jgi:hypothetical protein
MLKSKSSMVVSLCTFKFQIMDKHGHVHIGINAECSFEMKMFGCDSMAVIYCMAIKA